MFSDDGGVDSTVSSSRMRRARSRRGTFAGGGGGAAFCAGGRRCWLGFDLAFGFGFGAARFAATRRAPFRALERFADRAAPADFFFARRGDLAARLALRLAIVRCPFEP